MKSPPVDTDDPVNSGSDNPGLGGSSTPDLTTKPVKARRKRKRGPRKKRTGPQDDGDKSGGEDQQLPDSGVHKAKKQKHSSPTPDNKTPPLQPPQPPQPTPSPPPVKLPSSPTVSEPGRLGNQADTPSTETLPTPPSSLTPVTVDNTLSPEAMSQCISLLLDLLGWDVPPEYIVDSGFSLPGILYLFARLRLRLTPGLVERAKSANVPLPPHSILPLPL